jgi:hypothetical protein
LNILLHCSTRERLAAGRGILYRWRPAVPPARSTVHGLVPTGKGQAPGIATGLGVSGAGGAEPDPRVSASGAEYLPGAAGFFLAAFFLADFSVGFFLAARVLRPAPFAARFVPPALLIAFFDERPRVFMADLRPPALPAGERVSFFFLPDFVAAALFALFLAPAFLALAILRAPI